MLMYSAACNTSTAALVADPSVPLDIHTYYPDPP